jgi:hypothetical protein
MASPPVASTGWPTASPKSSPRRANSAHPENGQRLAGYARFAAVIGKCVSVRHAGVVFA